MKRTKIKAVLMASNGAGGMTQMPDRRFEKAEWPIRLVIEEQKQKLQSNPHDQPMIPNAGVNPKLRELREKKQAKTQPPEEEG